MTTSKRQISVAGISVEVVRKDIKNLHLAVYPPKGRVRVAVPLHIDDEKVRVAVVSRLPWIRRKQSGFENQDRQSAREVVTGETHFVHGRRHRLHVVQGEHRPEIRIRSQGRIEMRVRPDTDAKKRLELLHGWYRRVLRERMPLLVEKWEPVIGAKVEDWGIKRMKTRWGTCNKEAGRIWVNLELAKKAPECLEYIVVHEMAHLLEPRHDEAFRTLMDRVLPQWQLHRALLNRAPLSYEKWKY